MKKVTVLGLVILSVAALSGCTPGKTVNEKIGEEMAERAFEAQTGAKVDIDSQGEDITIKTEEGQTQYSAGGQAKLPDNFPKELIVSNDAKIIMSSSSGQSSTVSYITDDEQAVIAEKYIGGLTGQGWEKESEVNISGAIMLGFNKEKMNVAVNIGENSTKEQAGKSFVNVVFTVEEE
ncbi:MAG: hypothetical protein WC841_03745 [Candidatus Shapirobacteria bacterium]